MNYQHALLLYHTITPLHVGCGQDVGVVDLPVIRERTTGYPFIPGSGIRGSVRDLFERRSMDDASLLFGPTAESQEELRYAGCVAVHDARILLFPVRSDHSVFLWLTCPAVLRRFSRHVEAFLPEGEAAGWPGYPELDPGDEGVLGPEGFDATVYLEEFAFANAGKAAGAEVARQALASWAAPIGTALDLPEFAGQTVLVSDRTFHHFVHHATVLLQHNRLTSAKTVERGALFSVEAVPPETVFYGFFGATASRRPAAASASPGADDAGEIQGTVATQEKPLTPEEVFARLRSPWEKEGKGPASGYLHLGGDEGTGLGVTRLVWVAPGGAQ
jgi:CRISPR-associated protein Cmr4